MRYVERFYPNGAEIIDIIRDRHINKDFLHWGREFLTINKEEENEYRKVCNITNSERFWYSVDVHDSKNVVDSKNIKGSIGVFESNDIINSTDVVISDNVSDSKQIFYSSMIESCEKVFKGNNIVESINVCNSTMVARSKSVIDSLNVFDSSEIVECNMVSSSYFCQNCNNIKFCMFCDGISDAEYCIFNKQVDRNYFDLFVRQYKKYMTEFLVFVREWPEDLVKSVYTPPTKKFDDWYHLISEKTWKWVHTLPNFDSMLLYNITMLPEILMS